MKYMRFMLVVMVLGVSVILMNPLKTDAVKLDYSAYCSQLPFPQFDTFCKDYVEDNKPVTGGGIDWTNPDWVEDSVDDYVENNQGGEVQPGTDGAFTEDKFVMPKGGDGTDKWNDLIQAAGDVGGVHPVLLKAVMKQESGGAERHVGSGCKVNESGDSGLMQINNKKSGLGTRLDTSKLCEPEYDMWASIEVLKSKANEMANRVKNKTKPVGCNKGDDPYNPNHKACSWTPESNMFYVFWAYNGYSLSSLDDNNYAFLIEEHMKGYGMENAGKLSLEALIRAEKDSKGKYKPVKFDTFLERLENHEGGFNWRTGDYDSDYINDDSYFNIAEYYDSIFESGDINIKNTGVDDRQVENTAQTSFITNTILSKVANYLFDIARVVSIFVIGFIALLWTIAVLGYGGITYCYELLLKLTRNKVDVFADGLSKLLWYTGFAFLVSVIVISGLLPDMFALVYSMLSKLLDSIMRYSPF